MTFRFGLVLMLAFLFFSCSASVSKNPEINQGAEPNAPKDGVINPSVKTVNTSEIFSKDYFLKQNIQFKEAARKNVVITEHEIIKEAVRYSMFLQNDKKVTAENIDNTQPYCEIYIQLAAHENADNLIYTASAERKLSGEQFSFSEKSKRLNSEINSSVQFRIGFGGKPVFNERQIPMMHLECFDVTNLKELESHVGSLFLVLEKPS